MEPIAPRIPGSPTGRVSLSQSLWNGVRRAWHRVSLDQRIIPLLLVIFLVKSVMIAAIHPPFTGHDEVAHYAYLQLVATEHRIPRIPDPDVWKSPDAIVDPGDFDRISSYFWGYCRFSTQDWSGCGDNQCPDACYFHLDRSSGAIMPAGWIYTANHPPIYYLLMTPVFWLTDGHWPEEQLVWFRRAAIPFGMLTILFAWLTARSLFPRDSFLAITVPAVVAFQPQISYESVMLNNDILAIALVSLIVWLTVVGMRKRFPIWNCVLIGFFLGLALLAKTTSITVIAVIAGGMVLGLGWKNWRSWLGRGAIAGAVAALVSWPWYFYMYRSYGDLNALNRIHALQWWNYANVTPPTFTGQMTDKLFFWRIWGEVWGGFGWHLIPLGDTLLNRLLGILIVAVIGLAVFAIRGYVGSSEWIRHSLPRAGQYLGIAVDQIQVKALIVLAGFIGISYAAILQFGTQFQGTQARYAFPAVTAVALLVMLGIRSLVPHRWLPAIAILVIVGLIFLNYDIYTNYVIPWNDARD